MAEHDLDDLDVLAARLREPSVLGGNFRAQIMAVIIECREWREGAQDGQAPPSGNDPQAE